MTYLLFSFGLAVLWAILFATRDNGKSTLWTSLAVFVLFSIINYFGMPTLNFWGFEGVWLELAFVCIGAPIINLLVSDEMCWEKPLIGKFNFTPAVLMLLFLLGISMRTCTAFNSMDYQRMLEVETAADSVFNAEVHPIPVEKMRSVDQFYAKKLAEDKLGLDPGLGSRAMVGKMTIQNITGEFVINDGQKLVFNNDLIWVAPLEHTSFWKWVKHDYTPGYMIVDATNYQNVYMVTKVDGKAVKLRYIESACLNDDIERHIKNSGYATKGITDHCFEINNNGQPHWVLASYDKTIGFSGADSKGVITVNAQTGELNEYSIDEAPAWVDRIQPEGFITEQVNYWGKYKHGWWNSIWAEEDVELATPGMSLVYSQGRSYWYTGLKSAKADEGTSGFMLLDTKDKSVKLYRMAGVNETEAQKIAQDQQQAKSAGYIADFPILYNVRGIPTYFVTLKSESGNVMGYCFVAVNNRQAVGYGSTKTEAEKFYLNMLLRMERDKIKDGPVKNQEKEFVVRDITSEGENYYLLLEGVSGKEFVVNSQFFKEVRWTKPGHKISISYGESISDIIHVNSFDNMDFNF